MRTRAATLTDLSWSTTIATALSVDGAMMMPKVANGLHLDADLARARGDNFEYELRPRFLRGSPRDRSARAGICKSRWPWAATARLSISMKRAKLQSRISRPHGSRGGSNTASDSMASRN